MGSTLVANIRLHGDRKSLNRQVGSTDVIRRTLRIAFRLTALVGIGFALFKVVQNRRSAPRMPSGTEWDPPKRSETPLVDPKMLAATQLRRDGNGTGGDTGAGTGKSEGDGDGAETPSAANAEAAATATATAVDEPAPPRAASKPRAAKRSPKPARAWVEPQGSFCPSSHPVKAKLASGIFHLPGMTAYERTTPDRCYLDADAAESDGLRQAKR